MGDNLWHCELRMELMTRPIQLGVHDKALAIAVICSPEMPQFVHYKFYL
jgi:hypothetical protein